MIDSTSQPMTRESVHETKPAHLPRAQRMLGIIGGGQLARMLAQSAIQLGCEVVILERKPECPAAALASKVLEGDWDDLKHLLRLGQLAEVVTLENEFVDAGGLAQLEQAGHALWPTAETIRLVQDKLLQKQALVKAGLPVADFVAVADRAAVQKAGENFGWPLVLKKRRNGYDGKGNYTLDSAADIGEAWIQLGGDTNELYVERFFPFALELAVMVVRSQNGEEISYPVVETIQRDHICHVVKAPAAVKPDVAARATEIARAAAAAVKCVGAMGVELFLDRDGELV
ncbi:MAG TPA: ATP-grasp domain-containing protein, partial [Verrucomicrobiae bacterium]|nr:ATP-grasp domain-containing protein [Verrucomicrobiae bacterium]